MAETIGKTLRGGLSTRLLAWVGLSALALAGCGSGDGDADLKVAQARVSAKERTLEEAQSEAAAKNAQFCDASAGYITALDRYGDVINDTAPTVGDVKDAGTDLAQPREDAISSAEAAVAAQEHVVAAEQDLADAKAHLKAVKNTASGQPSAATSPATTVSAAPLVPSATVKRVEQADADFTAAQSGISDQTPLAQASQQFNAAAVALEMAWLRLFADAGCLSGDQQQQAEKAVRSYTQALQESLAGAGYYSGEVDGVYGPETVDAVEALQKAHGLPVTGTVDKATDAALQADLAAQGGEVAKRALASTAAVQQTLKLAGFWDGPVDGKWTPALTEALKSFQSELGVEPTGTVDAATVAALEDALAEDERGHSPSPTTSLSPAATSTPSDAASTTPAS
jgi:peptidoglycan hydrolase-like protein with peptidoglycan-binding domain